MASHRRPIRQVPIEVDEQVRAARAELYPALTDHEIRLLSDDMWADDPAHVGGYELDALTANRLCVTLEQLVGLRLAGRLGFSAATAGGES